MSPDVCSFVHVTGHLLIHPHHWLSAHSVIWLAVCSLIHGTCCMLVHPWHLLLLIHCSTSSTYMQPQCGIFFQSQDFLHIWLLRKNILHFLTEKWNPVKIMKTAKVLFHYQYKIPLPYTTTITTKSVISLSVQNPSALHHHYYNKETKTLLLLEQNPDCYLTIMTQPWLHYLSAMTTLMKIQTMLLHCNENPECATPLSWQTWLLSHCHYENLTHCAVSLPRQNPDSSCYLTALTKPWPTVRSHNHDKTISIATKP